MTSIIAGIEPAALWRNFETLTTIARHSRAEEAVIAHVREWAARNGVEAADLPGDAWFLGGVARLAGGSLKVIHGYAGWRPNLDFPLLATAVKVYEVA